MLEVGEDVSLLWITILQESLLNTLVFLGFFLLLGSRFVLAGAGATGAAGLTSG